MNRRRLRLLLIIGPLLAAAWAVWGWYWGDFLGPVTEGEARRYFARAVDAVERRDFDALCRLNSSYRTCYLELQNECPESFPDLQFPEGEELYRECREAAPPGPPTVVRSCYWPSRGDYVGGRILVVQGVNGRGKSFETEVLVFRDARSFKSQHTVYWSGSKFRDFKPGEPLSTDVPEGIC